MAARRIIPSTVHRGDLRSQVKATASTWTVIGLGQDLDMPGRDFAWAKIEFEYGLCCSLSGGGPEHEGNKAQSKCPLTPNSRWSLVTSAATGFSGVVVRKIGLPHICSRLLNGLPPAKPPR